MPDETTETPALEAAPAPEATPPAGPWAADAAEYFGDNQEAIAAFDRYMREKQQPYITKLEEESAPARELYKDLLADPDGTLTAVFEEIYGEEQGKKLAALLTPEEAAAVVAEVTGEPEAAAQTVPDGDREMREWYENKRAEEQREAQARAYQEVLDGMREAHPDLTDTDMKLIHPFISAAGGDTEIAYAGYQQYLSETKERLGVTEPAPEAKPEPPAVLGSTPEGGAAAAAPPVQKKYRNYDEAIDDFFAERRQQQPPAVL